MQLLRILMLVLCFNLLYTALLPEKKKKKPCQMDWECDETFVCEDGFCYELPIYGDAWKDNICISYHNCPEFYECMKSNRKCSRADLIH